MSTLFDQDNLNQCNNFVASSKKDIVAMSLLARSLTSRSSTIIIGKSSLLTGPTFCSNTKEAFVSFKNLRMLVIFLFY